MMTVLQRCRDSGLCPPSLLEEKRLTDSDDFEALLVPLFEEQTGLVLGSSPSVATNFESAVQMADYSVAMATTDDKISSTAVIEFRRCLLLAIVGVTPINNAALKQILNNGFLTRVKKWLDDILASSIGGVDLLLHLLTNVSQLPVSKSVVVSSGLGKVIGAIEKHKVCVGTKNETAIKERIQQVKANWNASVKDIRQQGKDVDSSNTTKRKEGATPPTESSPPPKKMKSASNSFSSLLAKASAGSSPKSKQSAADIAKLKADGGVKESTATLLSDATAFPSATAVIETAKPSTNDPNGVQGQGHRVEILQSQKGSLASLTGIIQDPKSAAKKSSNQRVKWSDHFGADLEASRIIEANQSAVTDSHEGQAAKEKTVPWSEYKKRDRLREKELLAQAKKSKIVDDDYDDIVDDAAGAIKPTMTWRRPQYLPALEGYVPPSVQSKEQGIQSSRMASVPVIRYLSETDVPSNPASMTDVEQALDMSSRSSANVAIIPFFAPPPVPVVPVAPPPVPLPVPPPPVPHALPPPPQHHHHQQHHVVPQPPFLAGSLLSQMPGLPSAFVNSNGGYDQHQTTNRGNHLGAYQPQTAVPPPPQQPSYQGQHQQSFSGGGVGGNGGGGGYRGDQNNEEDNLHVSGYGDMTTQTDIVNLFAQYVQVKEVVMKRGFAFVNTTDSSGARRAKEVLSGAMLGGSPIRINIAQRRARDATRSNNATSSYGPADNQQQPQQHANPPSSYAPNPPTEAPPLPRNQFGQVDYEKVRDDRGNPATKNLFVAGYGNGTSEQQLREAFGQHATITGCILKGTFSFVNTSDKIAAVHAREALLGSNLNGGSMRINFAKETGRLGTSFDSTYGPSGGVRNRF